MAVKEILERNKDGTFKKGICYFPFFKKGEKNIYNPSRMSGKKHSKETKQKMSESAKGRKFTKEHLENLSKAHLGIKLSTETKLRMSNAKKDEKHWNWKGGITPMNLKLRQSLKYKAWRLSVFERDKFTCQHCNQIGGELNADHIKPFAYFPELRFELSNGRTLCVDCHRKTDTWGRQIKKNKNG